jgi:hypothetical protein
VLEIAMARRRKSSRRYNPKRDGSPTRGERKAARRSGRSKTSSKHLSHEKAGELLEEVSYIGEWGVSRAAEKRAEDKLARRWGFKNWADAQRAIDAAPIYGTNPRRGRKSRRRSRR